MNTLELIEPKTQAKNGPESRPQAIHFPFGLLGFEDVKRYLLLANHEEESFMWLQMREGAKFSFRVVPTFLVVPDYQPDISDRDVEFLELASAADAFVISIVNLHQGWATTNLKGPIVINRHTMFGKQVIPNNAADFDLHHPLNIFVKEKLADHAVRVAPRKVPVARSAKVELPPKPKMKFRESKLAHQYLDGLHGLEIGGSAHNPFGLKTRNVDFCADLNTIFKQEEVLQCGETLKVDLVALGDELPLPDNSEDFVLSSHVIEHFFDPIKAIKEWLRVVRPGGYVLIIAPHKERTFDKNRARTPLQELLDRHSGKIPTPAVDTREHYSVWITEDLLELCRHLQWNVVECHDADDKVGNGFTILIQKGPATDETTAHPGARSWCGSGENGSFIITADKKRS